MTTFADAAIQEEGHYEPAKKVKEPEFIVCPKCGNHLVRNVEYFMWLEILYVAKCRQCKNVFERVLA